jgi:hypothetical protein
LRGVQASLFTHVRHLDLFMPVPKPKPEKDDLYKNLLPPISCGKEFYYTSVTKEEMSDLC